MSTRSELHHQKDGVIASWAHTCGHLSNPMWYRAEECAEQDRQRMEGLPCWECRNRELVKRFPDYQFHYRCVTREELAAQAPHLKPGAGEDGA